MCPGPPPPPPPPPDFWGAPEEVSEADPSPGDRSIDPDAVEKVFIPSSMDSYISPLLPALGLAVSCTLKLWWRQLARARK